MADCGQLSPAPEPARASSGGQGRSATSQAAYHWPIRAEPEPHPGQSEAELTWVAQLSPSPCTVTTTTHGPDPRHHQNIGQFSKPLYFWYIFWLVTRFISSLLVLQSPALKCQALPWWNLILPGVCVSVLVRAGSGFTSQDGLASHTPSCSAFVRREESWSPLAETSATNISH